MKYTTIDPEHKRMSWHKRFNTAMSERLLFILRSILLRLGWVIANTVFSTRIEGKEYLPRDHRSIILISNHFSWFDAPLLAILLPFQPAFLVATESQRHWWVRLFIRLFDCVPVWRGQVDRQAFRLSLEKLEHGKVIGIFPEGGMNPDIADRIARGEQIHELRGHLARTSGELVRPRAGSALLAAQSGARILPVGLIGTEEILTNLKKLRRTRIILRIGPVFGPIRLEKSLHGKARRQRLDELADIMMHHIAALFPPERRGPYRDIKLETL